MKKWLCVLALLASGCIAAAPKPPIVVTPPAPVVIDDPTFPQQCDDIWQQELGRHVDPDGLAGCLVQFRRGDGGGAVRAIVHDSPEGVQHRADLEEAKRVTKYPALTDDGPTFRSGGEPWRWKGVSQFKLASQFEHGQIAEIDAILAAFKGYTVLRVWDYTNAADGWDGVNGHATAWESTPADVWVKFLAYVGKQGFRVEITLLTDGNPDRIEPAKRLVAALVAANVTNVMLEAGNEPTTHKNINTAALRSTLEQSGFPYTSGDYEDVSRFYGTYGVVHTDRDSDWPRRAHDVLTFYSGDFGADRPAGWVGVPFVCDEPGKHEDVGTDPRDWRAYFATCALLGGGGTFHFKSALYGNPPTDLERSLASIALDAMNVFPADAAHGRYSRPDDASLRTYVVGGYAVRIRPTTPNGPFSGTPLDGDGILWRLSSLQTVRKQNSPR